MLIANCFEQREQIREFVSANTGKLAIIRYDKDKVQVGEIRGLTIDQNFAESVLEVVTRFGNIQISVKDLNELREVDDVK